MGWAERYRKRTMIVTDRQAGGDPRNNYIKKLDMMLEAGEFKAGTVMDVTIGHDDACRVFYGGFCDCNPDITSKEAKER